MEEKIQKYVELMSQDAIAAEVNKLMENENTDVQDLLKIYADNGLVLTAAELGKIMESLAAQNGELGEEDLDEVSGGVSCLLIGTAIAVSFAYWKLGRRRGWW